MDEIQNILESNSFLKYLSSVKSSGFSHHLPFLANEFITRLLQNDPDLNLSSLGIILNNTGYRSDSDIRNFKITLIGMCQILCHRIAPYHLDYEIIYFLADYIIIKIEEASSFQQLYMLGDSMIYTFKEYHHKHNMRYSPLINRCIQYVNQNLYSRLTISEISEFLKISPQYLSSSFKKETGNTLSKFILKKKVEEAQLLLKYSSLPISEIALTLGFSSMPHFSNTFRRYTGTTPSDYQKHEHFS